MILEKELFDARRASVSLGDVFLPFTNRDSLVAPKAYHRTCLSLFLPLFDYLFFRSTAWM